MGCGNSKIEDLPLVTLCKERRDFIKAAAEQRYALAAAHVAYFHALRDVGEALRKFVEEDLVIGNGSDSSPSDSPVLTLPSDELKPAKKKNNKTSSSSTTISHSVDDSPEKGDEIHGSHLDFESGSESELDSGSGHIHIHESPEPEHQQPQTAPFGGGYYYPPMDPGPSMYPYGYPPPYSVYPPGNFDSVYPPGNFGQNGVNYHTYYAKRSGTRTQSVVYEEPESYTVSRDGQYGSASRAGQYGSASRAGYSGYPGYGYDGSFGFSMSSPVGGGGGYRQPSPPPPPAPPSPPKVSTWDFLNVFDTYDYGNSSYAIGKFGSNSSSPDSKEVREREGIPELEEESNAETEVLKGVYTEKRKSRLSSDESSKMRNLGEGTSKGGHVVHSSEGSTGEVHSGLSEESSSAKPLHKSSTSETAKGEEIRSSSVKSTETITSKSPEGDVPKKKSVSFEVEEVSAMDVGLSKPSELSAIATQGTRDLNEVVKEIKGEFETASGYGKEVAVLLEVDKLPYMQSGATLGAILSRIFFSVAPSSSTKHAPSVSISSKTKKMAKAYYGDAGKDFHIKCGNISATLDKLYAWEKKLYKEVKDEEKLRVNYEKQCKRLKALRDQGADTTQNSKITATQATIGKLLTKLDICIRAIDAISTRIHKLRDEELQPQLTELIHGLIRMWRSMFNCHQKQFHAIMESKIRSLKANTGFRRDSSLRATLELEAELLNWCTSFNDWINAQKSYVESLNEWLRRCIHSEPEETSDGVRPFSPGRVGAPPIFVICNDWNMGMVRVLEEEGVSNAMHDFALNLHQLWERQDEAQRQRTKAEYLSKDFEKQLRTLRMEKEKHEDALSDKNALSKVPSESGVSPHDDLKVDLDSMRKKLQEERARHKEAMKLVHNAASNSLQAGLIPIFEALKKFSDAVLKAHEQVRLQPTTDS